MSIRRYTTMSFLPTNYRLLEAFSSIGWRNISIVSYLSFFYFFTWINVYSRMFLWSVTTSTHTLVSIGLRPERYSELKSCYTGLSRFAYPIALKWWQSFPFYLLPCCYIPVKHPLQGRDTQPSSTYVVPVLSKQDAEQRIAATTSSSIT